jgi:hypothetical protein
VAVELVPFVAALGAFCVRFGSDCGSDPSLSQNARDLAVTAATTQLQSSVESFTLPLPQDEFRGGGMTAADDLYEVPTLVQMVAAAIGLAFTLGQKACQFARQSSPIGARSAAT